MNNDCVYKILLLGDGSVGKTCLLLQYTNKIFNENHLQTIGLDYRLKTIELKDQKKIKLQIWDTAGQERFRTITKNYYKSAHGVVLMYDVSDARTFSNIKNWIDQIKKEAQDNVVIFIVGNKIDVDKEERKVTTEEGQKLAEEYNFPFYETSAKTGKNVNEVFEDIGEKVDKVFYEIETEIKKITKNKIYKGEKKCC
jgi:Ras-related protein Rab-8A